MVQGFFLWVSLIVALGPQNALVIKQGLRRHALGAVLTVCVLSDLLLVIGGIAGVDFVVERAPWLLEVLRWAGVAFLLWFAFANFKEARNPRGIMSAGGNTQSSSTDASPNPSAVTSSTHETNGSGPMSTSDQGELTYSTGSPVATLERTSTEVAVAKTSAAASQAARESIRKPVLAAIAMSWLNPGAFVDGFVMLGGMANQYGDLAWALGIGALAATVIWFPALGLGARAMSHHLAKPAVWQKINIGIGILMIFIAGRLALGV